TRSKRDWSSDVCSSDLHLPRASLSPLAAGGEREAARLAFRSIAAMSGAMKVDGKPTRTIWLEGDGWSVGIIDQTALPHRFTTVRSEERRVGKESGCRWR